jgi:hypothetical protein
MRLHILGILAGLAVAHGIAGADPGKFGSMSVFEKWKQNKACAQCAGPPSAGCCTPTHFMPSPTLFRAEVDTPKCVPGKSMPPIQLFRVSPPGVELVAAHPTEMPFLQATPPSVELFAGTPPHLDSFRREPAPTEWAPTSRIPSITVYQVDQPQRPCCPPSVCAPSCPSTGR